MTTKDEALKMAKQLRIKSSMILGGEKIAPFSECYLMEQVAKYLEALEQEPLNLNCKSVQKRLATQWGYIEQPSQEPIEWMLLKPEDRESLCKLLMMLKGLGHHSTPPPAPSCKCEECGMKYCECGERK